MKRKSLTFEEKVKIVIYQTSCSRDEAEHALDECHGDIVNAILFVSR